MGFDGTPNLTRHPTVGTTETVRRISAPSCSLFSAHDFAKRRGNSRSVPVFPPLVSFFKVLINLCTTNSILGGITVKLSQAIAFDPETTGQRHIPVALAYQPVDANESLREQIHETRTWWAKYGDEMRDRALAGNSGADFPGLFAAIQDLGNWAQSLGRKYHLVHVGQRGRKFGQLEFDPIRGMFSDAGMSRAEAANRAIGADDPDQAQAITRLAVGSGKSQRAALVNRVKANQCSLLLSHVVDFSQLPSSHPLVVASTRRVRPEKPYHTVVRAGLWWPRPAGIRTMKGGQHALDLTVGFTGIDFLAESGDAEIRYRRAIRKMEIDFRDALADAKKAFAARIRDGKASADTWSWRSGLVWGVAAAGLAAWWLLR